MTYTPKTFSEAYPIVEKIYANETQALKIKTAKLQARLEAAEAVCLIADRYDFRNLAEALDNWRRVKEGSTS